MQFVAQTTHLKTLLLHEAGRTNATNDDVAHTMLICNTKACHTCNQDAVNKQCSHNPQVVCTQFKHSPHTVQMQSNPKIHMLPERIAIPSKTTPMQLNNAATNTNLSKTVHSTLSAAQNTLAADSEPHTNHPLCHHQPPTTLTYTSLILLLLLRLLLPLVRSLLLSRFPL